MRSMLAALARATVVLGAVGAGLAAIGCAMPVVTVRDETRPAEPRFVVTATLESHAGGYYVAVISLRNRGDQPLKLTPGMFALEGTPPSAFVPAGRVATRFFQPGYRMPETVDPRGYAQGEIYWSIRGTDRVKGPVRLIATLPDGEHTFVFEFIE